jgi:hypothetical protein
MMSGDLECLAHTFHIIMSRDLTIPLYIQLQKLPQREPLLDGDLSPSSERERERERETVPSGVVPLMQAGWKAWEMVRKLSVQGNIEWVEPQVLDGWIDLGSCRFLFTPCPVLLLYHILF